MILILSESNQKIQSILWSPEFHDHWYRASIEKLEQLKPHGSLTPWVRSVVCHRLKCIIKSAKPAKVVSCSYHIRGKVRLGRVNLDDTSWMRVEWEKLHIQLEIQKRQLWYVDLKHPPHCGQWTFDQVELIARDGSSQFEMRRRSWRHIVWYST